MSSDKSFQWDGGFVPDSSPSRGDPRRSPSRPIEASTDAISNGNNTSTPVFRRTRTRSQRRSAGNKAPRQIIYSALVYNSPENLGKL